MTIYREYKKNLEKQSSLTQSLQIFIKKENGGMKVRELTCDVAVVAAGPSGLAAALTAAENNLKVIVLEKANTAGGSANMAMGPLGINTRQQKKDLVNISVEKAFNMFMEYTHWRVDAQLVKKYFDKSADTIEWLEDMGVEFFRAAKYFPGSEATWHIVMPDQGKPGPRSAATMIKRMMARAEELDIDILLETPVREVIMENGVAKGVIAENSNGDQVRVQARAVVIATGGFGNNPDMMKEISDIEYGKNYFGIRVPGLMGEGIRMAWAAGAGRSDINVEINLGIFGEDDFNIKTAMYQPNLMVNLQGERFFNEKYIENGTFAGNACRIQKESTGIMIIDERIKKMYSRKGIDYMSLVFSMPNIDGDKFTESMKEALERGSQSLFMADTLEELAEMCGIDVDTFMDTVDEYNEMCDTSDTLFGKPQEYMRPIEKGPFYAAKFRPGGYGTLGGIKVNHKMEVLTDDWEVIPGLFAAGTDTCTIYGDSYMFLLPGNTMGYALNSGRIAGDTIAVYLEENEE